MYANNDIVNPDKYKNLPNWEGIYLMGDFTYDIHKQKLLYLLKVGYSKNLAKRRLDYARNNRTAFLIDYRDNWPNPCYSLEQLEKDYHKKFKQWNFKQIDNSEWFIVDKEDFNKWYNKGFFGKNTKRINTPRSFYAYYPIYDEKGKLK